MSRSSSGKIGGVEIAPDQRFVDGVRVERAAGHVARDRRDRALELGVRTVVDREVEQQPGVAPPSPLCRSASAARGAAGSDSQSPMTRTRTLLRRSSMSSLRAK